MQENYMILSQTYRDGDLVLDSRYLVLHQHSLLVHIHWFRWIVYQGGIFQARLHTACLP